MLKKAIVTGHSKGLGLEIVRSLMQKGYQVMGIARSIAPDLPGCHQVALDLSDMQALGVWLDGAELARFLSDADQAVLVNNAGMIGQIKPVGRQNNQDIARTIALNVSAVMMVSNSFVALTDRAANRRIAHISSGAARKGYPGWSVYCGSKAALDLHALSMAEDNADNLQVTSIAPGIIDTDMQAGIRDAAVGDFPLLSEFQDYKASGALASSKDVATDLVSWLLSDGFGDPVISDVRRV